MFPVLGGWKLIPCPVLLFLPQWGLTAVAGAAHLGSAELRIVLLPRMWEICRTRASPEVRPRCTLHFPAAASLFPGGCCYPFKNKHPKNLLLKQAFPSPNPIILFQLGHFQPLLHFWFFGVLFTEFIKNPHPCHRESKGNFHPADSQSPSWLRWVFVGFFPLESRQRQLPPARQGIWGSSHAEQEGAWAIQEWTAGESQQEKGKGLEMWKWETKLYHSCWLR